MPEILFVHGTGVRRVAYDLALNMIRRQSDKYLNSTNIRGCLWGEPEGAQLRLFGASIPTYDDQPSSMISGTEAEEIEKVTWRLLRDDPLFEIRLLEGVAAPKLELSPTDRNPGEISWELVRTLVPPQTFFEFLRSRDLASYWVKAHSQFQTLPELQPILIKARRDPREVSYALARGLVATLVNMAVKDSQLGFSRETVDHLVGELVPLLGGIALAPFEWITKPLGGLARRYATYRGRRERRALSDATYPGVGDIVLYQKDGGGIRQFIKNRIAEAPGELVVLAHSLGGVAMVDLLILEDHSDKVKGLITVGTQAPFLYEIGALRSIEFGQRLPEHFPKRWLNIYDPNDFLSYTGEGVFGRGAVTDLMVESKMPFPDSHGAYWDQERVWRRIQEHFSWS